MVGNIVSGIGALIIIGLLWFFAPGILVGLLDMNLWLIKVVTHLLPFSASVESALRVGLAADKMLLVLEISCLVRLVLSLFV